MVARHAPEAIMANWMGFVLGWSESLNSNHPQKNSESTLAIPSE